MFQRVSSRVRGKFGKELIKDYEKRLDDGETAIEYDSE